MFLALAHYLCYSHMNYFPTLFTICCTPAMTHCKPLPTQCSPVLTQCATPLSPAKRKSSTRKIISRISQSRLGNFHLGIILSPYGVSCCVSWLVAQATASAGKTPIRQRTEEAPVRWHPCYAPSPGGVSSLFCASSCAGALKSTGNLSASNTP